MKLYDYQKDAVNQTVKELKKSDRCKIIMPCGTGKTLVGIHIRKRLKPKSTLVVAPSLALIKQLIDVYTRESTGAILVVCSDDSTAKEAREIHDIPRVTTDPSAIAKHLRSATNDRQITVFCTYQSTDKIAEVYSSTWRTLIKPFDFALFDEAHRMAGRGSRFSTALNDESIPIGKRVFMTATPRIATELAHKKALEADIEFASMDDKDRFGNEAYKLSLGDAIEKGYLTDYQVVIFAVSEADIHRKIKDGEDIRSVAKQVALAKAMAKYNLRKVITYHNTVRGMKSFIAKSFPSAYRTLMLNGELEESLWAKSLDGNDRGSTRNTVLSEFKSINGSHRAVLGNCKVLQEGVDCPEIDGIAFMDAKSSPVDIVQAIGRAIRNSPTKNIATIIVPVFISDAAKSETEVEVDSKEFAAIWDVLSAVKSHDFRVSANFFTPWQTKRDRGRVSVIVDSMLGYAITKRLCQCIESSVVNRNRQSETYTEDQICDWMREYHREHKKWPSANTSELVPNGASWTSIDQSLAYGFRGLPGGSSLSKLRKERLGVDSLEISEEQIWEWMQEYHHTRGKWPSENTSELVPNGSTWIAINQSLKNGFRGLPGGSSLSKLRNERLGIVVSSYTEDQIWAWMQEYHRTNGIWPTDRTAEPAPNGSTWLSINSALRIGLRGLPGGSSISKLRKSRI